jgi:hypothetical protein
MLQELVRAPEFLTGVASFILGCCVGYAIRALISFRRKELARRRRNIY